MSIYDGRVREIFKKDEVYTLCDKISCMSARIEFLEEIIIRHAFDRGPGRIHPHNKFLLEQCRISISEAVVTMKEIKERKEKIPRYEII